MFCCEPLLLRLQLNTFLIQQVNQSKRERSTFTWTCPNDMRTYLKTHSRVKDHIHCRMNAETLASWSRSALCVCLFRLFWAATLFFSLLFILRPSSSEPSHRSLSLLSLSCCGHRQESQLDITEVWRSVRSVRWTQSEAGDRNHLHRVSLQLPLHFSISLPFLKKPGGRFT